MIVLGVGDHVTCGSALVHDGKVIGAINDERLVREKMVFGIPRESIRMLLKLHGLSPSDVDAIAVASVNQHLVDEYMDFRNGWFGLRRGKFKQHLFEIASGVSKLRTHLPMMDKVYYSLRAPAFQARRKTMKKVLREEFGLSCPAHFLDHHFCHATSAYYTSGFNDALVVTIDGGGDGRSSRVFDVRGGRFKELASASSFDSLGNLYSYVTEFCGFKAGRHEGKITGLAAYGEASYLPQLSKLLVQENGTFRNAASVFFMSALKELRKLLPEDFRHRDLAASIQIHSEALAVSLIRHWLEQTGHSNVALAGGLFANVKINQRVHEIDQVESVFVHPGMSDEGLPLGAALGLYHNLSKSSFDPEFEAMDHVYLGPEFTDDEIARELESQDVEATHFPEVEVEIARLLAEGAVVARFNGRMEYGPRALGNRTILYQPTDTTVNHWMNDALVRTEFMPFAPVGLTEHADKCFKNLSGAEKTARFMTITFDCTDWMARSCPGVVHVDNTARPQLVSREDNPSMHRVLQEYHKLTGLPCLINTSFNMHEEPIVCTPYDAIRAFKLGRLDYLAIGRWIAKNSKPVERKVNNEKYDYYLNRRGAVKR
jgi:carbamoyltransferase